VLRHVRGELLGQEEQAEGEQGQEQQAAHRLGGGSSEPAHPRSASAHTSVNTTPHTSLDAPHAPPPRVLLLCGADVLDSLARPGAWADPGALLAEFGVVALTRRGTDVARLLGEQEGPSQAGAARSGAAVGACAAAAAARTEDGAPAAAARSARGGDSSEGSSAWQQVPPHVCCASTHVLCLCGRACVCCAV
jgi:nicotinic acid mononucleotide adenylyltransferase